MHDTQRVTLPIRNGPARGYAVTVPADDAGHPPADVLVRVVNRRAETAPMDVEGWATGGWTQYLSQRGSRGWELVVVVVRPSRIPTSN